MEKIPFNRRHWLSTTMKMSALAFITPLWAENFANGSNRKKSTHIGACDWSIGPAADIACFDVARRIGLDGVQVSLNTAAQPVYLQQAHVQQAYLDAAKRTGVRIGGLAIGALNDVPYKSDPRTEQWVHDSIGVAKNLGVKAILLAFFAKNDLRNDPTGISEVVRRLKAVAPLAERAGVQLGIESYLTAEQHLDIIDRVGSSAIKVYYDARNATDAGNDIFKEISLLGKKHICELHIKENGVRLGNGTIDWPRVRQALAEAGYEGDGWMQIEWAKTKEDDTVAAYQHNLAYVKRNLLV
ncbi:sugar phosphate isomerase/epimerase [Fibrella sp. HMF5335]|uniref:Sugar phosphate isomerase/epimerase n=1 Tax=Fibrella rubiginis TaxID=2817060 RepID=A0A939GHE1_9BACT|nr:sugar phosphate isomerase/epimerase family protein [Fibrella rubiginis]MBO0937229.1 sugar phosphate isomerase/epimerase [Fibrella rubiginis]